jgi:hypothetical protein
VREAPGVSVMPARLSGSHPVAGISLAQAINPTSRVVPNMRLKLSVRALYIGVHPLWYAARAARSLSATR